MSDNTTVLILDCQDGFRVEIVSAIENITKYKDVEVVNHFFKKSKVFHTLEGAYMQAMRHSSEHGIQIFKWDKPITINHLN